MNEMKSKFIMIDKQFAQRFLDLISLKFKSSKIVNAKLKNLYEDEFILFPLKDDTVPLKNLEEILENQLKYEIVERIGVINPNYKVQTLEEALKRSMPEEHFHLIPKSFDTIGKIAILEFDNTDILSEKEYTKLKSTIAKALLKVNRNAKTVYEKISEVKGPFRLRDLKYLTGKDTSLTTHKENNCSFKVDVKTSYFTPRLVFERKRISTSQIDEGEIIIDLFAGVGPFSIQIAKTHNVHIHAFDINENAFEFLKKNIEINQLIGDISAYNLDVKEVIDSANEIGVKLKHSANRIIMNLPERSLEFLDVATYLLKPEGGILHIYLFSEKPDPIEKGIKTVTDKLSRVNWKIENILNSKIVKAFSPKSDLIVLDLSIKPDIK